MASLDLVVGRALPTRKTDGQSASGRGDGYGNLVNAPVVPTRHQLVEEGSYWVAYSPTISTGMTQVAAQTAFSDTAPNWYILNSDLTKSIYVDYVKMIATAAATSATAIHYALIVDNIARAFTTDNTAALTQNNPNSAAAVPIVATVKWQNSATVSAIAASSGSAKRAARGVLGGLNIAGDEMLIVFGSTDVGAHPGLTAAEVAGVSRRVSSAPGVVIGPGHSAVLHLWAPGSSASFNPEVEIGLWAH